MRNILKLGALAFSMMLMFSPQKAEGAVMTDCSLYRYCVNDCQGCVDLCAGYPWYGICVPTCSAGQLYCPGDRVCQCGPVE